MFRKVIDAQYSISFIHTEHIKILSLQLTAQPGA